MILSEMTQGYLTDLDLLKGLDFGSAGLGLEWVNRLQSRHIAKYSFNSLAVVLSQDMPLETELLYQKIVEWGRGGYCFEHNKLVYGVLSELGFDVRVQMARVVYNKDVDVPRTHRFSLLTLGTEQYIVDAGFGHFGPRFPVKLALGIEQRQGNECYRIIKNAQDDYCFQHLTETGFFTLYTFDLGRYSEADCLSGHFYSHKYPHAAFVNSLVVCRKLEDEIRSLRNGEYHHIQNGEVTITLIKDVVTLHSLLVNTFELDIDRAVVEFLFSRFVLNQ